MRIADLVFGLSRPLLLGAAASVLLESCPAAAQPGVAVWVEDSLTKVLPTAVMPERPVSEARVLAVRNEHENAQVVVRAGESPATITCELAPVTGPDGPKPRLSAAFVGFVPIRKGTPDTPETHLVAKPPVDLPDPILPLHKVEVPAGSSQPIWLSVYVPGQCAPGEYRSELSVISGGERVGIPVVIRVLPVTLPDQRTLEITNWFSPGNIASAHGVSMWSEGYWKLLEAYARLMADHRQTMARTLLFDLITAREDERGRLSFDFSRFDRFVRLFEKAGVLGTIEGSHLAYRTDWKTHELRGHRPVTTMPDGSRKTWGSVPVTSPEQRDFLSQFLPALMAHLDETGWKDRYIQHLADEPVAANAQAYNTLAKLVREFAPGIRTIDATMCREVAGSVDIWVPQQSEIDRHKDFFEARRKLGEEVWFYTCLNPKGRYTNRFIDYHLLSVRLMHWMNYRYDFPGYLHWGLNFWLGDPYTNVERGYPNPNNLPAGDSHIVYPGARGPLSSIRLEAMRDGIEDYDLLRLLAKSDRKAADDICASVARSWTDYTLDPAEFRRARARLLDALERQGMTDPFGGMRNAD